MKNISYRVALGGIISALCLLAMFMTGVFPALSLVLPMISGVLLMIVAEEVNKEWAFLTYAAVGLLALFTTFDKESALIFIMFFGHYPIVRMYLQKIKSGIIKILLKLSIFNVCILSHFYLTAYMLGMTGMLEEINDMGNHGGAIMLIIVNLIFALYDNSLEACYYIYIKKIKSRFNRH